jgi:hypothetical protein
MKLLVFSMILVFPLQVYAYLDPGSASLIVQGVIAAIASVVTVLSLYWQKFKSLFRKKSDDQEEQKKEDETIE